ncbi:MAG: zeta toxin family protein [Bifidobacteriaceae bacterium]|jgi:predicted ABC-type ATPase|nr:zeta toxin family protein [Bifidobacteriaceae bacterium]
MAELLVIAGPNGSGKSSLTKGLRIVGLYVNADEIKAVSGASDLAAAQEAAKLREALLAARADFTFETVLSTDRNLDLLRRAREAGYAIAAVFVLTLSAELNRLRVRSRVLGGGHDVPAEKIRSRYAKSLANLPLLNAVSDSLEVYDNTGEAPRLIYRRAEDQELIVADHRWSQAKISRLIGLEPFEAG